ncbi:uncharacterized protein LOC125235519 [Leguminivora glycinivorella]|uniref:uncharacterized protein LOC125235519 n=1 Tax=Leguminivora glycinivorella TaxID=1035111 RepID=UPI00200DD6C7|nr:uncharacterized protein LOC125235519 [Leguminivora glycinivorella]
MKLFYTLIFFVCVTEVFTIDAFTKNCCPAYFHPDGRQQPVCADGSYAETTLCCGRGPCNVVCCNCDIGCIEGPYSKGRVYSPLTAITQSIPASQGVRSYVELGIHTVGDHLDDIKDKTVEVGNTIEDWFKNLG